MEIWTFLESNKGLLGGVSIAVATVVSVMINLWYDRRRQAKVHRRNRASFAAAISSELTDNFQHLIEFYIELDQQKSSRSKINTYKHFEFLVYEKLLDQIGDLGPSLSFIVVDVYGDIRKLKVLLDSLNGEEIYEARQSIQEDVQTVLVKALTGANIMLIYADFLNGRTYMKKIYKLRMLWLESCLDQFCQYVAHIDKDMDFVTAEDDIDMEFLKRFPNKEDRHLMRSLLKAVNSSIESIKGKTPAHAQLVLRSLSYKMRNSLTYFLSIEPPEYDLLAEEHFNTK